MGVSKQWDDFMKKLVEENPQALVSFFLAGAVYEGEMSRELITRTIIADGLYHVKWNGESIVRIKNGSKKGLNRCLTF